MLDSSKLLSERKKNMQTNEQTKKVEKNALVKLKFKKICGYIKNFFFERGQKYCFVLCFFICSKKI